MKRKFRKIFESTIAKAISIVLIVTFIMSIIFCFDFYNRQINKVKGYYWIYQGDKAFKKQDLQHAVEYYELGIKLHPGHSRAMYNLANIYIVYEDYYSALKNYKKALEVRPKFEVARINYAIILSETYKIDEAIEQYEKVIENKPKFIKIPFIVDSKKSYTYNTGIAYYNMGLAYRAKSLYAGLSKNLSRFYLQKALEQYEKAVKIIDSYETNYNLGLTNQLLGNENQAGHYYCIAIEKDPMEYSAHFNLGILLKDMKNYKAARDEFRKAGLLLDTIGDVEKTRYIYNVLLEVNQKLALFNDSEYFKKINEEEEASHISKYKAGKLVIDYNSDPKKDKFLKNFKRCSGYEIFVGENNKKRR